MIGQDFIAEEIDGNYRATIRDANKPQYQIYRKGSEALLKYITQYNWNFHMDDFEGKFSSPSNQCCKY